MDVDRDQRGYAGSVLDDAGWDPDLARPVDMIGGVLLDGCEIEVGMDTTAGGAAGMPLSHSPRWPTGSRQLGGEAGSAVLRFGGGQFAGIGLEFLTGELQGSHDPAGVLFTVLAALSGMEREYIRDRTLEGQESARIRGKSIGGASVTDNHMLSMALHLRSQEMSLRDIASQLVVTKGKKKGQHPSPATILRLLRENDETTATATTSA